MLALSLATFSGAEPARAQPNAALCGQTEEPPGLLLAEAERRIARPRRALAIGGASAGLAGIGSIVMIGTLAGQNNGNANDRAGRTGATLFLVGVSGYAIATTTGWGMTHANGRWLRSRGIQVRQGMGAAGGAIAMVGLFPPLGVPLLAAQSRRDVSWARYCWGGGRQPSRGVSASTP